MKIVDFQHKNHFLYGYRCILLSSFPEGIETEKKEQKTGKWRKFKFTAFDESWIFYEIKWNSNQYNYALFYPITNVYLKEILCEKWSL